MTPNEIELIDKTYNYFKSQIHKNHDLKQFVLDHEYNTFYYGNAEAELESIFDYALDFYFEDTIKDPIGTTLKCVERYYEQFQ